MAYTPFQGVPVPGPTRDFVGYGRKVPKVRWPNDARLSQAVAQMWTRIGVRTQVDAMPFTAFVPRRSRSPSPCASGTCSPTPPG